MQVVPGIGANIDPDTAFPDWTLRPNIKLDDTDPNTLSSLWINDDPVNDATVLGVLTPPQGINVLGTPLFLQWVNPITVNGGTWPMETLINPDTHTGDTGTPPSGPHLTFDDASGSLAAVGATGGVFQWSLAFTFQPTVGVYDVTDYAMVGVCGNWFNVKPRPDNFASMQLFRNYDGPGQSSGVGVEVTCTKTSQVYATVTITPVLISS